MQPDEATSYLGKMFGPWGEMTVPNFKRQIDDWARSVAAAQLKPLQALETRRDTILPRVKARILHSQPSLSMLKGSDNMSRVYCICQCKRPTPCCTHAQEKMA